MTLKIPPPPMMTGPEWAGFNRWLLELTSILADTGGIDPASVEGFEAALIQLAANTAAIAALQSSSGGQSLTIAILQGQVNALTLGLAAANSSITTLSARGELLFGTGAPAAGLGKVNDWYGDTAGAAGARVWIKKAVGVWTAFPF
jgi:hypothetical protein